MDQANQADRLEEWERREDRAARRITWLAFFTICIAPLARASGPVMHFNLPAELFPQAILDFYRQSGVQAIYAATPRVEKLKTQAVSGVMSSSEALSRMLAGTGMTFVFDSNRSVIIRPQGALSATEPPKSPKAAPAVARHQTNPPPDERPGALQQVEVTGSLIHGVQDVEAPLLYIRRAQLDQAAYATVQDALYSLPLVSLNGPREDLGIDNNFQYGAGINLRGLGVGATLVLVNGYRQPLGGLTGDFVDVSTIPFSAVKRIEVLPDGASAIYGADAVAGVVNVIMRDDFTGVETQARYGSTPNGRAELMVAQLLGKRWHGGHALLAYQYSDATPLQASARAYAANADKTGYGGHNYDSYYSNPGNILNPLTMQPAFALPAAQNGASLNTSQLSPTVNLQNPFADYQIFPERTAQELYGSVSQQLGSSWVLFAQGRYTQRDTGRLALANTQVLVVPSTNAFYVNPYPGVPYTLVAYSFQKDLGPTVFSARSRVYMGTVGARVHLGTSWQLRLSESVGNQSLANDEYNTPDPVALAAALADSNPDTAFNPFGDGSYTNPATLSAINRNFPRYSADGIEETDVVADGSIARLPAGEAKLAVGFARRTDTLDHDVLDFAGPVERHIAQRYSRHVVSLFSQLDLPLIGNPNNSRATPRLMLDVAGRYDHYSDFGGTFNPTARLEWTVGQWLKVRGSWGRSYRAPKLDDLYDTSQNVAALTVLPDPTSASGRSLVLGEQGSNPNLREETARTWTLGADIAPWRGSELSLTYYAIDYLNRIAQPAADDPFAILTHETEWSAVITRNPTQAQIAALCNSPQFVGSVAACLTSRPAAIVDLRLANLSAVRTRGLDVQGHERLTNRWGRFVFGVQGTYVFSFKQSVTPTSPTVNILDTVGNPLGLRLRGTAGWSPLGAGASNWAVNLAVNYTGAYRNPSTTPAQIVSSWTTVDAQVRYRIKASGTSSEETDLTLNAVNALNHDPPFVDSQFGYDPSNMQPLGRVLSLALTERW